LIRTPRCHHHPGGPGVGRVRVGGRVDRSHLGSIDMGAVGPKRATRMSGRGRMSPAERASRGADQRTRTPVTSSRPMGSTWIRSHAVGLAGRRARRPTLLMGNGKGLAIRSLGGTCGYLGDSCGRPELLRRDADEPPEVVAELALVLEPGARHDLRQGAAAGLQKPPGPLDAAGSIRRAAANGSSIRHQRPGVIAITGRAPHA
jgi:hypothetical protein